MKTSIITTSCPSHTPPNLHPALYRHADGSLAYVSQDKTCMVIHAGTGHSAGAVYAEPPAGWVRVTEATTILFTP